MSYGIDLGTSNSAVARWSGERRRAEIIAGSDGSPTLPSVVHCDESGQLIVGNHAVELRNAEPDRTFEFFKRHMGTDFAFTVDQRELSPVELSAAVLRELKGRVTEEDGAGLAAVVTVPAYFAHPQRSATRSAVEAADIELLALINEPTAAAYAYALDRLDEATVLVYDLGGGTFDVSIVRVSGDAIEVIATDGDHELGGKDWDDVIVEYAADAFEGVHGFSPLDLPDTYELLRKDAENAKRQLSERSRATLLVACEGHSERVEIDREVFEGATAHLLDRTWQTTESVIAAADLETASIDSLVMVGGSSRMPACREMLQEKLETTAKTGLNPDEVVALGASAYAASLADEVSGRSAPAASSSQTMGLATLRDVTAHTLGNVVVSASGDEYVTDRMIAKNSAIPAEGKVVRNVAVPRGRNGELRVYVVQGEQREPWKNLGLGSYLFDAVPGEGNTEVEIAFRYDRDGLVTVSASVDGRELGQPVIDLEDVDLSWTQDPPESKAGSAAIILTVDVSGSMAGSKLQAAQEACQAFAATAGNSADLGIVSFGSDARVHRRLAEQGEVGSAIRGLSITGSTNMAAGIDAAANLLRESDASIRAMVVLTDGVPDSVAEAVGAADRAAGQGIEIVPVGIGDADESVLEKIATADHGTLMTDLSGLGGRFEGIAQELTSRAALGPASGRQNMTPG